MGFARLPELLHKITLLEGSELDNHAARHGRLIIPECDA